jgi:sortase A
MEVPTNTAQTEQTEVRYLTSDKRHQARRSVPLLRIVGNLLIVTGLLLLLGIGGWYGYTLWSNEQFKEQSAAAGWVIEPTVEPESPAEATAVPTAVVISPLPVLNQGSIGSQMVGLGIGGPQPRQDDSPPIHLAIPSVKIDSKVVPISWTMIPAPNGQLRSEWQVADYAVGHHAGSANPGQPGNVVMSGHVDYKGQVFKELHNTKKGDEVIVQTEKGQYLYVITQHVLVKEEGASEEEKRANARYMDPTPDPTLTMITCWPYGIDTHRLIVIAKPYQSPLSAQSEFTIR